MRYHIIKEREKPLGVLIKGDLKMNWKLFETINNYNLINTKGVQVKHFDDFMEMAIYLDDNNINIKDANMNSDVFLAIGGYNNRKT